MSEDDGSSHYASLFFIDQNQNNIPPGASQRCCDQIEDVSNKIRNDFSVSQEDKFCKWVSNIENNKERYLPQEMTGLKYGSIGNQNHDERDKCVLKYNGEENPIDGCYARTSNYAVSQNDRCGNWRSSKNVPSRQNEERHHPDTNHYTMAWIEDQNR